MKRLSNILEKAISDIDATAGKLFTSRHASEERRRLKDMPYELILANGQIVLDVVARSIERFIAKPAYAIESLLLSKSPSPRWIYG